MPASLLQESACCLASAFSPAQRSTVRQGHACTTLPDRYAATLGLLCIALVLRPPVPLHQLIDAVSSHVHVLKDSLSLIRQLESMSFPPEQNIRLTSADIAALDPSSSISIIEHCMTAQQLFMTEHQHSCISLQWQ